MEVLEKSLAVKEEDVRQLSLQLELKTTESQAREEELHLRVTELQVKLWFTVATVRAAVNSTSLFSLGSVIREVFAVGR